MQMYAQITELLLLANWVLLILYLVNGALHYDGVALLMSLTHVILLLIIPIIKCLTNKKPNCTASV